MRRVRSLVANNYTYHFRMYIIALCYLLTVIHLFSDRTTVQKYSFDLKKPFTLLTSFFIHLDATHYYTNVIGFFFQSFFIDSIFKDNLLDLLVLALVSHSLATLGSYFYYGYGGCGSSGVLYSCVALVLNARLSFLFGYDSYLSKLLGILVLFALIMLDKLYTHYKKSYLFFTVSHVAHFIGLITGYIYWLLFIQPSQYDSVNVLFESNSFWESNISMSVNLHLIPIILVYLYKIEFNAFITLDKHIQRLSKGKLRLYNYEYIEVGRTYYPKLKAE